MANFVYRKAKEALLNGDIDVLTNQLKILLLKKPEYTPNENTDQYVSDIPANAIVLRSEPIVGVTSSNGTLNADDITITNYNGSLFGAIAAYQYAPLDTNARLIFYIDSSDGLPYTGLNTVSSVTIIWNEDSTKILTI